MAHFHEGLLGRRYLWTTDVPRTRQEQTAATQPNGHCAAGLNSAAAAVAPVNTARSRTHPSILFLILVPPPWPAGLLLRRRLLAVTQRFPPWYGKISPS